jgi:hypothetical protein
MIEKDRSGKTHILATALAGNSTIAEAAKLAGLSEPTVYRRLRDPQFQTLVRRIRGMNLSRSVGLAIKHSVDAVQILISIMNNPSDGDQARIVAAKIILDFAMKGYQHLDLGEQLKELIKRAEAVQNQAPKPTA